MRAPLGVVVTQMPLRSSSSADHAQKHKIRQPCQRDIVFLQQSSFKLTGLQLSLTGFLLHLILGDPHRTTVSAEADRAVCKQDLQHTFYLSASHLFVCSTTTNLYHFTSMEPSFMCLITAPSLVMVRDSSLERVRS